MRTTTTRKKTQTKEPKKRTGFTFEDYVVNTLNQIQNDFRRLNDKIDNRFMWMFGITLGTFATLVGLI